MVCECVLKCLNRESCFIQTYSCRKRFIMKSVHLILWLLILSFSGTAKRVANDELLKILKELIGSDNIQDDQASASGFLEPSDDENVILYKNEEHLDKALDDFGQISYDNVDERSILTCGNPAIKPDINQRIVNGKPAKPHSWPWQINLQGKLKNGTYVNNCGGSIISNNIVLTAAHCFYPLEEVPLNRYLVVAGAHNLNKIESVQKSKLKSLILHNWIVNETHNVNDIAILIMKTPFTFNKEVSPVCLPKKNSIASGTCYVTGWGDTRGTGDSKILHQVGLPVLSVDVCNARFTQHINESHICAGQDRNKNHCHGDSGGPLVCFDNPSKLWHLHGIVSMSDDCQTLSVTTRVAYYLDWIKKHTGLSV